jgi:hypothetical protein
MKIEIGPDYKKIMTATRYKGKDVHNLTVSTVYERILFGILLKNRTIRGIEHNVYGELRKG